MGRRTEADDPGGTPQRGGLAASVTSLPSAELPTRDGAPRFGGETVNELKDRFGDIFCMYCPYFLKNNTLGGAVKTLFAYSKDGKHAEMSR